MIYFLCEKALRDEMGVSLPWGWCETTWRGLGRRGAGLGVSKGGPRCAGLDVAVVGR